MEFVRIGLLAVVGIALGIQFKSQKQEYGLYLGLALCPLIFSCTITWVCEFVAGICRDSGFSAVAAQVELFGKIAVLFAGMPVFLALAETVAGFAG